MKKNQTGKKLLLNREKVRELLEEAPGMPVDKLKHVAGGSCTNSNPTFGI